MANRGSPQSWRYLQPGDRDRHTWQSSLPSFFLSLTPMFSRHVTVIPWWLRRLPCAGNSAVARSLVMVLPLDPRRIQLEVISSPHATQRTTVKIEFASTSHWIQKESECWEQCYSHFLIGRSGSSVMMEGLTLGGCRLGNGLPPAVGYLQHKYMLCSYRHLL